MSGTGAAATWIGIMPAVVTQGVPLPVLGTMLRVDGIGRFSTTGRIYIVASYDVGNGLRDQLILRYEAFSFPGMRSGSIAIPVDLVERWD